MKKISPKKYAIALYEAAALAKKDELPKIMKGFVELLVRNNALKLSPRIIKELVKYYNEKAGILEIEVTSAKELNVEIINKIKSQFEKGKIKEVDLKTSIDLSLLGGLVCKIDDILIDGSLKKELKLIKQSLA